jgi:hypothetical protein
VLQLQNLATPAQTAYMTSGANKLVLLTLLMASSLARELEKRRLVPDDRCGVPLPHTALKTVRELWQLSVLENEVRQVRKRLSVG